MKAATLFATLLLFTVSFAAEAAPDVEEVPAVRVDDAGLSEPQVDDLDTMKTDAEVPTANRFTYCPEVCVVRGRAFNQCRHLAGCTVARCFRPRHRYSRRSLFKCTQIRTRPPTTTTTTTTRPPCPNICRFGRGSRRLAVRECHFYRYCKVGRCAVHSPYFKQGFWCTDH